MVLSYCPWGQTPERTFIRVDLLLHCFAAQGVNLPGADIKVDVLEDGHAIETLVDVTHFQNVLRHVLHSSNRKGWVRGASAPHSRRRLLLHDARINVGLGEVTGVDLFPFP